MKQVRLVLALACISAALTASKLRAEPLTDCVDATTLDDKDGDTARNLAALSAPALRIATETFDEGQLTWHFVVIENRNAPSRVLWFVPHNNEHAAFDTAVDAVGRFGGTVVAVKTGGKRFNGPQDPNRNFDLDTGTLCRDQVAHSPVYTDRVMRWRSPGAPIVALHTNALGFAGDGKGGRGTISIAHPVRSVTALRATGIPLGQSPDDTMIFVATLKPPAENTPLMRLADRLRGLGVNIAYETVRRETTDCSLSNYAAVKGIDNYFNIEVVDGDSATQRRLVGMLMETLLIWPR